MDLQKIDKHFKVNTEINKEDLVFYSALDLPFHIYGLIYENGKYRRLPEAVAKSVSEGVYSLHAHASGGRVRFRTNSNYIAISAQMENIGKMDHFALTGSAGFDLYTATDGTDKYFGTFRPPFKIADGYESVLDFEDNTMREITINFPLYSDVVALYIGLQESAIVEEPTPYAYDKPIVYYGHSITQGGCASRPGNSYPNILSRRFNIDFVNLGFSGNACGEQQIADYIANLDMKILVMDYDHNAPTPLLQNTHEKMFRTIRASHPSLPIVMMTTTTMPRFSDDRSKRRGIVYKTYQNAKNNGDQNVYFWDGAKEFAPYEEFGTVEGCHPNDYGFAGIAQSLGDLLAQIL